MYETLAKETKLLGDSNEQYVVMQMDMGLLHQTKTFDSLLVAGN